MTEPQTAVALTPEQTIGAFLQTPAMQKQIGMALPRGLTPERMTRIALTEMRRNPKLALCTRESFAGALFMCAQFGLEPGPMGLAYLIPYGKECQFQPGYKGLLALAWRSSLVKGVQAECVHENDHFDFEMGLDPKLAHRPADGDRGEMTHAYAVIQTTTGGTMFRVMSRADIDDHRDQYSQAKGQSPWKTAYGEMACKTVLKRVLKLAPVSAELQSAVQLDDFSERGLAQDLSAEIDITPKSDAAAANAALGLDTPPADDGVERDDTGAVVPSQAEVDAARDAPELGL